MVLLQVNFQAVEGQDISIIKGRVIDKDGRPVAHAVITLHPTHPPERGEDNVDGLIESYQTGADGRFSIPSSSDMLQEITLYVTTPMPPKAYAPLTAPFMDLTGATVIPGHPIVVNKNGDTDVGDVPLTVRYGMVILSLQDAVGLPFFKRISDHPTIRLRVRTGNGQVMSKGDVPSATIAYDTSSIRIALPEGQWNVEVAVAKRSVKWRMVPESLNIRGSGDLRVTFRMPSCK